MLSTTYTDLNFGTPSRVFHAYDHSMFYPIQLVLQHSMQVAAQSAIFCIVELLRVVIARFSNLNNIFPDDSFTIEIVSIFPLSKEHLLPMYYHLHSTNNLAMLMKIRHNPAKIRPNPQNFLWISPIMVFN